jgi:hypothetical protein
MKKLASLLLSVLVMLCIVNCGDDNGNPAKPLSEAIIGKWLLTRFSALGTARVKTPLKPAQVNAIIDTFIATDPAYNWVQFRTDHRYVASLDTTINGALTAAVQAQVMAQALGKKAAAADVVIDSGAWAAHGDTVAFTSDNPSADALHVKAKLRGSVLDLDSTLTVYDSSAVYMVDMHGVATLSGSKQ